MKFQIISYKLLLLPIFVIAQHSDNYLKLMGNLTPIDSSTIATQYKDGKPDYSGTTTYYKYQDKKYAFLTGKHIKYYRNGSRTEGLYDSWGTILENRYFDKEGNLISESKTFLIDSDAKNIEEFDKSMKHITFIVKIKDYKYSNKQSKWYIYKESEYTDSKKSGVWNYYLQNGVLEKQKSYN